MYNKSKSYCSLMFRMPVHLVFLRFRHWYTTIMNEWKFVCKSQLNFRIQNAGFELLNVTSYDNEIGHKVGNCIRIEIADVECVNLTYLISKKKKTHKKTQTNNWPKWKDKVYLTSKWQFHLINYTQLRIHVSNLELSTLKTQGTSAFKCLALLNHHIYLCGVKFNKRTLLNIIIVL